MITPPFALVCLALACFAVSLVYALISPGTPEKVLRETVQGFGVMFGGILLLAVVIVAIPWILGR